MYRLTVSLARMVPPTRRQVEVPSDLTLAGLHEVIQVLFDWDGDHLYEFVVGRRRYADPYYLEACEDDEVSPAALARSSAIPTIWARAGSTASSWMRRSRPVREPALRAVLRAWGRNQPSTTTIGRDAWTLTRSTSSSPSSRCNARRRLRHLRRLRQRHRSARSRRTRAEHACCKTWSAWHDGRPLDGRSPRRAR